MSGQDSIHSLLLILTQLHEVSPAAEFVAKIQILRVTSDLAQLDHSVVFRLVDLLAADVGCSPSVEEADFAPFCHVIVDKIQLFVVFISEIHGVAVPETQEPPLCLCVLV